MKNIPQELVSDCCLNATAITFNGQRICGACGEDCEGLVVKNTGFNDEANVYFTAPNYEL